MPETLDAAALRRWCAGALAALRRQQTEINGLNVYPVPDGDTGTNLVLTLASAERALARQVESARAPADPAAADAPPGRVLRLLARGALLGARGNSGVIVAQLLGGLSDALGDLPEIRGRALAAGLGAARRAAYAAVSQPVEGTVLSVAAAAADAAERADSDELPVVARAAATAAHRALARTPEQLPALARAGVVDAGGRGLCVLLDALVEVITGAWPARPDTDLAAAGTDPAALDTGPAADAGRAASDASPAVSTGAAGAPSAGPAYEVQFLLDAEAPAVARLRTELARLGDSLVVVGDEGRSSRVRTWRVHVHVDDVGAAFEAAVVAGRPYQISVSRFDDTPAPNRLTAVVAPDGPDGTSPAADRAVVVAVTGAGLAEIFAAEGATVVRGAPSAAELLTAIRSTGAARVVVLPNDRHAQATAGAAAEQARPLGIRVSVVPTRSPVQALAALAVRDPARRFDDDVIAMAEAAGACRYGEIRHADREALTVAGRCRPGDVLGLVDGEVHVIGTELLPTCTALLDRMLGGGGELVTLLLGAHAPDELAEAVRAHLGRHWPFVEVHHYSGGQPGYPLLVGVE